MEGVTTNSDLFVLLKNKSTKLDYVVLFDAILTRLSYSLSEEDCVTLKEFCRRFARSTSCRWRRSHRKMNVFEQQYKSWLETNIDWPSCVRMNQEPSYDLSSPGPSTSSIGIMTTTPRGSRKPFEDLGNKQKKRRSNEHEPHDPCELAHIAAKQFKETGQEHVATVIEHILKNPEAAEKFSEMIKKPRLSASFTPEKALGLFLSLKLTKWQYMTLRESAIREGVKNMYPSYYKLQQSKLQCYPPKESLTVTDSSAKIELQALLDITVKRIIESLPSNVQNKQLTLVSKWGFDGASSQSRFKQKMDGEQDDSSIFMTSLVPLKLTVGEETLWINPKPCSVLFCRPISFIFTKENKEVVISEKRKMDEEIAALSDTQLEEGIKVSHKLMMTMIDGKICTYLSEVKSNASCYICLAKPTEMNRLETIKTRTVFSELYDFGLSSLHARINVMECLLHISYRLDLKTWAVRGDDQKNILKTRKDHIQKRFKDELNLLIDIVKQGSGTTNDGNTARRFFEFPDKTAAITGLDEDLVRRFAVILQAITCGEQIDINKFKEFTLRTAEKYVELYDWYYMSSTVHKLLIHGADIIASNSIVPIGCLSEEAAEARNKDFRRFREHHSRKKSRTTSNEDIIHMLLLSSDPLLSTTRPKLDAKKKNVFFTETLDLLMDSSFECVDVPNVEPDSELDTDQSDIEN